MATWATFKLKLKKLKKFTLKKCHIFSKKKLFHIFEKMELFKQPLIFQEGTFQAWKIKKSTLKKLLFFSKWNFLATSLKIIIYISGLKLQRPKNKSVLAKVFNIFIFCMKIISAEERKVSVLAFFRFKKGRIGALRKKLPKYFTAIFGILNDIFA